MKNAIRFMILSLIVSDPTEFAGLAADAARIAFAALSGYL